MAHMPRGRGEEDTTTMIIVKLNISEDETLRMRISETVLASLRDSQASLEKTSERAMQTSKECKERGK